ncbi:serine carboxypeptidase [Mycena filopes]|nr:serine carboxypeptidase [Mycena filopes]
MRAFHVLALSLSLLQTLCVAQSSSRSPFPSGEFVDDGQATYTTLRHDAFPEHSVRIRPVNGFCDSTVNSFVGYIDIRARHLFFYYFESRNEPATDDVVLWLNGGPGASATLGLFMELGPCTIISDNATEYNPYSWNSKSNLLFVDQPVGVGFSYADYGETVDTTEAAAKDIAAFLAIFLESMPGLQGRPLHIAGESYGGRYVPLFAAEVYDQNRRLGQLDIPPVNLVSALIGNGCSDRYHSITSYYDMQCSTSVGTPIQSISACTQMKQALPRCQKALRTHCEDSFDMINCQAAQGFCSDMLVTPFDLTGKSFYDMRTECIGEVQDTLCYPQSKHITKYLNASSTRTLLGIDETSPDFSLVGWTLNSAFTTSGDVLKSSAPYIAALLERGVRVLVYAGTWDLACNFVGNDRVTRELEWYGQEEFGAQPLRDWLVEGKAAGETRAFGELTFATLRDAGHQVPHDSPVNALEMLNRWLAGVPL